MECDRVLPKHKYAVKSQEQVLKHTNHDFITNGSNTNPEVLTR
jgi:hypothetical protein